MEVAMSEVLPRVHQCQCHVCKEGMDLLTLSHHQQINLLLSRLDEAQRRWYVASLSAAPDAPSDRELSRITGLDEKTIRKGRQEMQSQLAQVPVGRQRIEGGGRPAAEKKTRP
jgi:hypothetical protein